MGTISALIWSPYVIVEETTDLSDKSIVLAEKNVYQLLNIRISYLTNSTSGSRQIELQVLDKNGKILYQAIPGVTQAASLQYYYNFSPSNPDLTSLRNTNKVFSSLPIIITDELWVVRVFDSNAVSTSGSGENMFVYISCLQRTKRL